MLWHWWRAWRERRRPRLEHLQFIMYTRQDCHLCERAWEILQDWQRRRGFRLEAVDIDDDEDLQKQFGQKVPVVAVNGKVRFWGHINPVLLKRLLDSEEKRLLKKKPPK